MKKLFAFMLSLILVLSLSACASPSENEPTTTPNTTDENTKTLVVYYSATGNTKQVAQYIASERNGKLFELTPKTLYTNSDLNWRDENSRVTKEHNDTNLQNVELTSTAVDDWDAYNTIYIGYPIWWGIAAWPVNQFILDHDFSGKTVIPFCTAASSDIGQSGKLLADMAGSGD